jgi:hypothetical protein
MPFPDEIRKCAAFIGIIKDDKFLPRATGFAVSWIDQGTSFRYFVTAEHVISGLSLKGHQICIRVNLRNGETAEFIVPPDHFHEGFPRRVAARRG